MAKHHLTKARAEFGLHIADLVSRIAPGISERFHASKIDEETEDALTLALLLHLIGPPPSEVIRSEWKKKMGERYVRAAMRIAGTD